MADANLTVEENLTFDKQRLTVSSHGYIDFHFKVDCQVCCDDPDFFPDCGASISGEKGKVKSCKVEGLDNDQATLTVYAAHTDCSQKHVETANDCVITIGSGVEHEKPEHAGRY